LKKILIISPHFPPSNLAAVHRARLFAIHLPSQGWTPHILTVDEKYYEEKLDWDLLKLVPTELEISKVSAFAVTKPRLIGDIGLRGFLGLYKKALSLIHEQNIAFIYIHIPSFYVALLGRLLNYKTGIPYGIDYIDPWVHEFPGSNKLFSRHWFSSIAAKILEPVAVKKASIITGVSEGYYKGVIDRNPNLLPKCTFGAMPYGGEMRDHDALKFVEKEAYLFPDSPKKKIRFVYAGAMLPKAYEPLKMIFQVLSNNAQFANEVEFHFIGTGKFADDPKSFNIKDMAEEYRLWKSVVFEYPARIPYLDVLVHLKAADAIFVLGSTEPHYTPSKVFQSVLSRKPILAVLHTESAAIKVVEDTRAGICCPIKPERMSDLKIDFRNALVRFLTFMKSYQYEKVDMTSFEEYSAKRVTMKLVELLNNLK